MHVHAHRRIRNLTRVKASASILAAIGLTCGVTGCGGSSGSSESGGLTEVTIGGQPNVWGVPFQLAVDKGYFKEHGLKVKTVTVSASTGTASLKSGSVQFLPTSPANFATALSKGLPFTSVSAVGLGNPLGLVVSTKFAKANGLTSSSTPQQVASALKDSKPGTSSTNTQAESEMFLKSYGVDGTKLAWVTLPNQSSDQAAIANNQIDWFLTSEPLPEQIEESGSGVVVVGPEKYDEWGSKSGYGEEVLTQTSYAKKNPKVTKSFVAAMAEATKFMHDHPTDPAVLAAAKTIMTGASDKAVKKTIPLVDWSTNGKQDKQTWADTVAFMNALGSVEGGAKVSQDNWTNDYTG